MSTYSFDEENFVEAPDNEFAGIPNIAPDHIVTQQLDFEKNCPKSIASFNHQLDCLNPFEFLVIETQIISSRWTFTP